jgi:hypothetical protein
MRFTIILEALGYRVTFKWSEKAIKLELESLQPKAGGRVDSFPYTPSLMLGKTS